MYVGLADDGGVVFIAENMRTSTLANMRACDEELGRRGR